MGMMKKLTVLDIGDKIAIRNQDDESTIVGTVLDILDYWDEDVYHVDYLDGQGRHRTTSVSASDIDLVKQKELYFAS
jgi:hypothetical protein